MTFKSPVKLGILSFAHMHAYNYALAIRALENVELTGIWDPNAYRGTEAARQFQTHFFPKLEMLLKEVDGVIICAENARHKELVLASAEAGKHILCEKPIATTLDDADEMIQACEKNSVQLQIAFPMRYSPSVQALKKHVEAGDIGDLLGVSSTNHGQIPPGWFIDPDQAGGGALMDHTVHLVDLLRWIFKKEVVEVYAETGTLLHDIPVEDTGLLSLSFEDGGFATVDCSWSRPSSFPSWGDVMMRVYGTQGVIELDAFSQSLTSYNDDRQKAVQHYWGTDMDEAMIVDFASAIREGREVSITGLDGKKALEVALAAYRSTQEGKPVRV